MNQPTNPLNAGKPLLFAHRGSSLLAPENTFTAFDIGLQASSDVLEIDVRLSRDKEVIVIHDERVDRTTDGSGAVSEHTLVHLKRLDAGYRFEDERGRLFRGRQLELPTLLELYAAYPDVIVNIDIKDKRYLAARLVAKVIEKAGAERRTVVASFHGKVLRYFRQIAPHIATSATFKEVLDLYLQGYRLKNRQAAPMSVALQIPTRYGKLKLDTPRFIDTIHRSGQLANFWTVNDPQHMRMLLQHGADGIVTDRPDLAVEIFRELGFK
ncbi:MAG: glycerophosphodiester phosphodiesterase [Gammaproteobacteria bacterium]|nr:glycerophosphodiester phosphodiesterase [Gammaproteobacteria bacterium]